MRTKSGLPGRNVHIGSCAKVDREAAMQKARVMKAEALGVKI